MFKVVILAAGMSSRMCGEDKMLKQIKGDSMLCHVAKKAVASKADKVCVVLGFNAKNRIRSLKGLKVETCVCNDFREGMAATLRFSMCQTTNETEAIIVAFADMPFVCAEDYNRLILEYKQNPCFEIFRSVTVTGKLGHPILFGKRFFNCFSSLKGDAGAKEILALAKDKVKNVETTDEGAIIDLDTPFDWYKWKEKLSEL